MNFLIITQDLRISGTSQGIIERSFLSKLRKIYPEAIIDVLYLCSNHNDENLDILPINSIKKKVINRTIPFHVKWINRISRRFFNYLYAENKVMLSDILNTKPPERLLLKDIKFFYKHIVLLSIL